VRRDVWRGRPWVGIASIVIQDDPELLAVYIAEGAEIEVAEGDFPIVHSWSGRRAWRDHGIVVLHRPRDAYSIWVFWEGPNRDFWGWYLNLETPLTRTAIGYDTHDHELDLWSRNGRDWHWKDAELMEQRVSEGLFTAEEVAAIRLEGERAYADVSSGGAWWDERWAEWTPPTTWQPPRLPPGWNDVL
jgi:hypothetical protein